MEALGAFGSLWEPLGAFGSLWEPLGAFWTLWEPLEAFGSLWKPFGSLLKPSGAFSEPLGAFGSLWELFGKLFRLIERKIKSGSARDPILQMVWALSYIFSLRIAQGWLPHMVVCYSTTVLDVNGLNGHT